MQLITYFANDGDLLPEENLIKESSSYSSPKVQDEPELIPVEAQDISSLSISQHQHVNDLLGEAMRENEQPEGTFYSNCLKFNKTILFVYRKRRYSAKRWGEIIFLSR